MALERAEKWLRAKYPGLSSSQSDEIFARGWVRDANGRKVRKGDREPGPFDCTAWEERLQALRAGAPDLLVPVLAEEGDFLVVDKPVGIPGHPLGVDDTKTISGWALARGGAIATEFPEPLPTLTPHRLDTDTSGCLVVATTRDSFDRWRSHFTAHDVEKEYLAWVWGPLDEGAQHAEVYLAGSGPGGHKRVVVPEGTEGSHRAELEYEAVGEPLPDGASLVRVKTRTGVTHQVRAVLASVGLPLLGDSLYGDPEVVRTREVHGHQLRAVALRTPEGIFQASEDEFRARFS